MIRDVKGTEYVENITWVTCGTPRHFVRMEYRVDGLSSKRPAFWTVAKTVDEARKRLLEWAVNRNWNLTGTSTVKVSRPI